MRTLTAKTDAATDTPTAPSTNAKGKDRSFLISCVSNLGIQYNFQAIGLAPNPGLPPVMYATSSMLVFFLSVALAGSFPNLFKPVVADLGRVGGIALILIGLYLLAGGKFSILFRTGG